MNKPTCSNFSPVLIAVAVSFSICGCARLPPPNGLEGVTSSLNKLVALPKTAQSERQDSTTPVAQGRSANDQQVLSQVVVQPRVAAADVALTNHRVQLANANQRRRRNATQAVYQAPVQPNTNANFANQYGAGQNYANELPYPARYPSQFNVSQSQNQFYSEPRRVLLNQPLDYQADPRWINSPQHRSSATYTQHAPAREAATQSEPVVHYQQHGQLPAVPLQPQIVQNRMPTTQTRQPIEQYRQPVNSGQPEVSFPTQQEVYATPRLIPNPIDRPSGNLSVAESTREMNGGSVSQSANTMTYIDEYSHPLTPADSHALPHPSSQSPPSQSYASPNTHTPGLNIQGTVLRQQAPTATERAIGLLAEIDQLRLKNKEYDEKFKQLDLMIESQKAELKKSQELLSKANRQNATFRETVASLKVKIQDLESDKITIQETADKSLREIESTLDKVLVDSLTKARNRNKE